MTQTHSKTLSVQDAAETRRSIRQFVQEPMNQADLREILRLTGLAPSASNVQPWRFAVVQSKELQAKLQEAAYGQKQIGNAPAVIVLYSDMEDALATIESVMHPGLGEEQIKARSEGFRKSFEDKTLEERARWANAQTNIALGYLLLTARSLGYDTSPMLGFDPQKVKELLKLPEHAEIAAIVALGKRAEEGFPHHRHALERTVTWF